MCPTRADILCPTRADNTHSDIYSIFFHEFSFLECRVLHHYWP